MPPTLQDQCMCMDQFGMHLLGQQKMENTKQIIDTNPLLEGTKISNYKVVPHKAQPHVNPLLALHLALVALALNSIWLCNGSKIIIWCTIIVMILEETTILSLSAKALGPGYMSFGQDSSRLHSRNISSRSIII
jgi:hypothetical protein